MERHQRAVSDRWRPGVLVAILIVAMAGGCGGNGGGSGAADRTPNTPTSTPTEVKPTQTSTATPRATPTASPSRPAEPSASPTPTPRATPTGPPVEGLCFVGAPACNGTSVPTTRDACCDLSRTSGVPLPVFWCPEDQIDPVTHGCRACSDPCEGRPTATVTVTPTPPASPSPEPCDVTDACPAGAFCELPAGVCASDLDAGTCVEVPDFCFDPEAPVCGCDGLTYGSDCLRRAARVPKSADGPCPAEECRDACDCYATRAFAASCPLLCPNCGSFWTCEEARCLEHCGVIPLDLCAALCTDNEQCAAEAFCRKPIGHCDGLGACRPRPQQCPDVVDPVCGCDGATYSNECDAGNAGVTIAHRGECRARCGTSAGIPCPGGSSASTRRRAATSSARKARASRRPRPVRRWRIPSAAATA